MKRRDSVAIPEGNGDKHSSRHHIRVRQHRCNGFLIRTKQEGRKKVAFQQRKATCPLVQEV
jgi:hypothetical protein